MYAQTRGLVLRETAYRDADKLLTVLTEDLGKLTLRARGARRRRSPLSAATQQLTYSAFTLFESRGRWSINEAEPLELFPRLREDLDRLALGCYFAQVLEQTGDVDLVTPGLLRLGLNALYALSSGRRPPALIKAAFELKLLALSGYEPDLSACRICGQTPEEPWLSLQQGVLCCGSHRQGPGPWKRVTPSVEAAMNYVLQGPEKKLFSFSLPPEELTQFQDLCEAYLHCQLDREFSTLAFWKGLPRPAPAEESGPGTPGR